MCYYLDMSERAIREQIPTRREVDQRRSEAFDEYVGPFSGDVYLTALNCFPGFSFLRDMSVSFDPNSAIFTGGVIESTGEPSIHIGTKEGAINNRMKSRLFERFQLPEEARGLPDEAFKPIIFAHELGHVIQNDPLFEQFYGKLEPGFPDPNIDYSGYVHSDLEANADFIAAQIISNAEFGKLLGIMPPTEGPSEWRDWADAHKLPNTTQAFPNQIPSV